MPTDPVASAGERARQELAKKLEGVPDEAIMRPHTDPHAAAVTAILVSDWLLQDGFAERLDPAGVDVASARELGLMARALVGLVAQLGGDYLPEDRELQGDALQRGAAVRASTIHKLESALPDDAEMKIWLDSVRLGVGPSDLVYDLRTLAELLDRHSSAVPETLARLPGILRASADALEQALRSHETPEQTAARSTLARIWTVFVPAYERAAAAGRAITRQDGAERSFPSLALVASHRRAKRRPISLVPPVRRTGRNAPFVMPPAATASDAIALDDVTAPPSAPSPDSAPSSSKDSRRARRAFLELEVGVSTESNFYVGFTENLSNAGVFVATYIRQPIGARLNVALTMPDGETMILPGRIRWTREATRDGWPGLGVEFESLTPEHEAKIRKFLSLREPLFYDDE